MPRRVSIFLAIAITALVTVVSTGLTGCGESKSGALSPDQHVRIQKGMTMDDVEAVAGTPERSHKKGSSKDPNIIWYYTKTEGEGMVKISFMGGKVDLISPYDTSILPEE